MDRLGQQGGSGVPTSRFSDPGLLGAGLAPFLPQSRILSTAQAVKHRVVQSCPLQKSAWQARPVRQIKASEVKTTEDYKDFVRMLEQKYPDANGFELNRAIRQHYYSDGGRRNSHPVFDKWLGREGGMNNPALKGIEKDLEGLPGTVVEPNGRPVNLAHQSVGIDTYYREKMLGEDSLLGAPARATQRFMLTNGGDYAQTAIGTVVAPFDESLTVQDAWNQSSREQLNGNDDGLAIGDFMTTSDSLSGALSRQYPGGG